MTETLSPYEAIAGTHPRMRGDVLYTQTPSGVLFHNAQGGFNVSTKEAYRFATLLVPHLNGERWVEELCQGMGDRQRDMVVQLVRALYARGFARDAAPGADEGTLSAPVAERFAEQIAYLDHYADAPAERFNRFRDTRVAVLGDDPLARWCVLSLLRNGCATIGASGYAAGAQEWHEVREEADALASADCAVTLTSLAEDGTGAPADAGLLSWSSLASYDVVVVTGHGAGARQVVRLLEQGVPTGRTLLPAWPFGRKLVVGPSMTADGTGCWSCAALRLGANGDAADVAQLWSGLTSAAPLDGAAAPVAGPLAAMAGNLLGYEVFRQRTGALPAETERQVIVQDLDSLDVAAEPLLPHPRCPYCAPGESAGADFAAGLFGIDLDAADPVTGQDPLPADGAADEQAARDALAELERRSALVQEQAGVFGGYADEDWEQTPLKISTVRVGVGHGRRRAVSA